MRFLLLLSLAVAATAQTRTVTDAEAMEVHRSALLIDSHNDFPFRIGRGMDIGVPGKGTHTDIPRLKRGGVGAVFFAAYVAPSYVKDRQSAHRALEVIDMVRSGIVAKYPETFAFATSAAEILKAREQGKIAALIGIEGGHAIEDSPRLLRSFYALGVRYMTLTHSNTNGWADSSGDIGDPAVAHHGGLTAQGREIVREMNRLGMMVDISHVSDRTFADVLETSAAPVFASHSSCRALANVPRNLTDDMIRALAKKGGLVNINFSCDFLSQASADVAAKYAARMKAAKTKEERRAIEAEGGREMPRATLADVVAHIGHVVKLAGIGAVGIGSDFDGITCSPEGLDDVSQFPRLTRALLEHGYTAEQIRKLYGGNMLRFMGEVQQAAAR